MGLYMHAAWFNKSPEMLDAFEFWIDEILSTYNNVFFVTMNDVLKFMQQPFPIRYCFFLHRTTFQYYFYCTSGLEELGVNLFEFKEVIKLMENNFF